MMQEYTYIKQLQPMVNQEKERLKKLFETDDVISVGCSFVYLVDQELVAKNSMFAKGFDEEDYDPELSDDFAEFLGVRTAGNAERLKIRRKIRDAAHEFYEGLGEVNTHLQDIAGAIIAGNEEYVLNHIGDRETNGTVDILGNGFTTNQKRSLERLSYLMNDAGFKRCNE